VTQCECGDGRWCEKKYCRRNKDKGLHGDGSSCYPKCEHVEEKKQICECDDKISCFKEDCVGEVGSTRCKEYLQRRKGYLTCAPLLPLSWKEGDDPLSFPETISSFRFEVNELSDGLITNKERIEQKNAYVTITKQLLDGVAKKLVPGNFIKAMGENNFLGLIMVALFLSLGITKMEKRPTTFVKFLVEVNLILQECMGVMIRLCPIAVFSLCAGSFGKEDRMVEFFRDVGILVLSFVMAILSHILLFMPVTYFFVCRENPFLYITHFIPSLGVAFASGSSIPALPVSMLCASNQRSIPKHLRDFVLSLGATINIDGSAIYITVVTLYLGTQEGLLSGDIAPYILTIIMATLGSAGAASVPSASFFSIVICYNAVFGKTGIPDSFSIILPLSWLIERFMATCNVAGDAYACGIISALIKRSEQKSTRWYGVRRK